jgi:hypothetical protein
VRRYLPPSSISFTLTTTPVSFFWAGEAATFEDDFVNSTADIKVWRPWVGNDPASLAEYQAAPAHTTTAKTLGLKRCSVDAAPMDVDIQSFTNGCIWYSMPYSATAQPDDTEVFGHALFKPTVDAVIFYSNEMTYTAN